MELSGCLNMLLTTQDYCSLYGKCGDKCGRGWRLDNTR